MHYMDANYTYGEKVWRQLHKNAVSNIEQVLEAIFHKEQLYGHRSPIMATLQVRRTIHAGISWRSKDDLISDIRQEPKYSSSVPIQDIVLNTSREQWTIETRVERGSGRSVLAVRHDDDDDDWVRFLFWIYFYLSLSLQLILLLKLFIYLFQIQFV